MNPFRRASAPHDRAACRVEPFPLAQHQMVDWLGLMHRQHTVHALLEVDVTDARRAIREHRSRTGEGLSFTAFVVANLARAVDEDRRMHAYRRGRSRLVLFDEVDVTVLVETDVEGARIPFPHIVRAANRKTMAQVHAEIRAAQAPAPRTRRAVAGSRSGCWCRVSCAGASGRWSWPTRAVGSGSRVPSP